MTEKTTLENSANKLRERARGDATPKREAARAELARRRDNLQLAVIPVWEKMNRCWRPSEWQLW